MKFYRELIIAIAADLIVASLDNEGHEQTLNQNRAEFLPWSKLDQVSVIGSNGV